MRGSWWLVVGSWLLAGAAVVGVYVLGHLHGEIAAMTESGEALTHGQDARGPGDGAAHTGTTGVSPVGAGQPRMKRGAPWTAAATARTPSPRRDTTRASRIGEEVAR